MKTFPVLVCLILVGLFGCGASARPRETTQNQGARSEDRAQEQAAKPEDRPQDQVAGSQDKVLVPGDPPLAQEMVDRITLQRELLSKTLLTVRERKEYQRLLIEDWKRWDKARKEKFLKYEAEHDPIDFAHQFNREDAPPSDKWWQAVENARSKELEIGAGGSSYYFYQRDVDARFASIEWALEVELTQQQREEFQRLFMDEWKKLDAKEKLALIVANFPLRAFGQGDELERNLLRSWLRGTYLLKMCGSVDDPFWSSVLATYKTTHATTRRGVPPAPAKDVVLIKGSPSLTQDMVDKFSAFVEWAFEARMNQGQREALRNLLVDEWKRQDKPAMDGSLGTIKLWTELDQLAEADRTLVRAVLQPQVVKGLSESKDKDKTDRWLWTLYESAHQPLAHGKPPLTRPMADAHAEMVCFVINEAAGREAVVADKQFKDDMAKRLAAEYPKYDAANREQLANLPSSWAMLRAAWPKVSEAERTRIRQEWAKPLAQAAALPGKPSSSTSELSQIEKERQYQRRVDAAFRILQLQHEATMSIIQNMNPNEDQRRQDRLHQQRVDDQRRQDQLRQQRLDNQRRQDQIRQDQIRQQQLDNQRRRP